MKLLDQGIDPTRFTKPLEANADGLPVTSDGYRLIALVHKYWQVRGKPLRLDDWQQRLLIRILERCPSGHARAGQLRFRQCVVSIPRQAGKSLLAAVLALYGLLQHQHSPKVLGVARSVQQANVVYGYLGDAVRASDALTGALTATGTRGIRQTSGAGTYKCLPAKMEAIQGYESTLSIVDELHVLKADIWDAIVESQRAQRDPLLIGITTAGDISSTLLKRLYAQGIAAVEGQHETFGFFVFEASEPELTIEQITLANPAVACGRIDAQTILDDCTGQPPSQWKRFTLNLFVEGLAEPWIPVNDWAACAGRGLEDFYDCTYAFESNVTHTTIYAAKKIDGKVYTAIVARLLRTSLDERKAWAQRLRKAGRCSFVVDYHDYSLVAYMQEKGWDVTRIGTGGSRAEAAMTVFKMIKRHEIEHDNSGLVNTQHATAKIKTKDDAFIIVSNGSDIDACYASVYAIYAAEIRKKRGIGIA